MKVQNSKGAEARKAHDGPQIDADKLVDSHDKWFRAEQSSNSDAGVRRQEIGALADEMNLNGTALSQFRAGMKMKNSDKQRDWIRSLKALVVVAEEQIMGNQPDMLPDEAPETSDPVPEPMSDQDVDELNAQMSEEDDNVDHVDFSGDAA